MEPNIQKALSRLADEYNRIWELRYQDFENEHLKELKRKTELVERMNEMEQRHRDAMEERDKREKEAAKKRIQKAKDDKLVRETLAVLKANK